jgi:hypothetical protein
MKKRTKISLRTKIYLTIGGMAAMAGIIYAANPTPFSTGNPLYPGFPSAFFPTGVAMSNQFLLVTPYCEDRIVSIDCAGNATVFAQIPGFGSCREKYMAMAPTQSANAGFHPRDAFVTQGPLIYKVDVSGGTNAVTLFANLSAVGCTSSDHNGITFDKVGTFGNDMIVTCQEGTVFRVNGAGGATHIATLFPPDPALHALEGPAVPPVLFGPHGGKIWIADELANFVHVVGPPPTYTVTLNVLSHVNPEGLYLISNQPCTFCTGNGNWAFATAEQQLNKLLWVYPTSDFQVPPAVGGNLIITSEGGGDGTDTSIISFNGLNYVQTSFPPRIPGVNEGSAFIDCDIPTPTPTTTPTTTPTATATFTPTATATFTPTATATFTPTPTATATFTPTPTPTPTPSPTAPSNISQITPTGTTCQQFRDGTAETLLNLNYSVQSGKIKNNVTPGVFFYWVKVTVPAGNNVFTITETITTGNFNTFFNLQQGGSGGGNNVYNSNCGTVSNTITQNTNTGTVTVSFNAPVAGTYIIGLKYDSKSVVGANAPSPGTTVHYNFATTGVPGSTSGLDLIKQ